ncbi:hypothetical protein CGZ60_10560 [Neisseria animalis]|nr:hypothetical protein CGZ60_10560 [Neisseria animalis]
MAAKKAKALNLRNFRAFIQFLTADRREAFCRRPLRGFGGWERECAAGFWEREFGRFRKGNFLISWGMVLQTTGIVI